MDNDNSEVTLITKALRRLKKDQYNGDNQRRPRQITITDILPWVSLIGVCVLGINQFATMASNIEHLESNLLRLENVHIEWNKSISERVRELEKE